MRRRTLTIDEDTHTKLKGLATQAGWSMNKFMRLLLRATTANDGEITIHPKWPVKITLGTFTEEGGWRNNTE